MLAFRSESASACRLVITPDARRTILTVIIPTAITVTPSTLRFIGLGIAGRTIGIKAAEFIIGDTAGRGAQSVAGARRNSTPAAPAG